MDTLKENSGAMRIIKTLLKLGVDTFFGIPGGPVCPIFEALRLIPGVKLIESRHETHAAFSASTFYKTTGKVPAVVVTAGPGITNVVTGAASAYLEQIPMIIISGDVPYAAHGGILAQDCGPEGINIDKMFEPITNAQIRIASKNSVVSHTVQAYKSLDIRNNPRPVLLVAPLDKTMASVPDNDVMVHDSNNNVIIDDAYIAKTANLLINAKHPLIVLGGGTKQCPDELGVLISTLNIPFVTTPRAKGVVTENHRLSLRNGGMAASWWARKYTQHDVDVALVLGTDLDDTSIGPTPYIGKNGKLIHVDRNPSVLGRNLPTELSIQCDLEVFIKKLRCYFYEHHLVSSYDNSLLLEIKSSSPYEVNDFDEDVNEKIAPHKAIADIQRAVPLHSAFITDIGEHMLFALHYLNINAKERFNIELNLGSMGSGIAGAIGLALADKSRPVVCICGDGGMQMSGMEILTAIKEELPIIFCVFNDGRYNMVHHGMKQIFGSASEYNTPFIDFSDWGNSIGISSMIIEHPNQLTKTLVDTMRNNNPYPILFDIRIDESIKIKGGGRVEALQHMSMLSESK